MIRQFDTRDEWNIELERVMLSYNATINSNTRYTPYELKFEYESNKIYDTPQVLEAIISLKNETKTYTRKQIPDPYNLDIIKTKIQF